MVTWPPRLTQHVPGGALRAAPLAVAALLALPVGARGAEPPEGTPPVRVLIDAEPAHLNPLLDPDVWAYRISHDLICEPLIRRRPGPEPAYEPVLAERFRVDDDGYGVDLALRRGVRFHDGRALTAHDVRFTLERLYGSGKVAPRTQALLADLKRVIVLSPDRLRLELYRPSALLLQSLGEIDILPEHLFSQGSLAYQPHNRRPVCTGPYRLQEWRHGPGGEIVLRRNLAYWGPAPAAPELRFLVTPDAARALASLRRGGGEVLGAVPALYYPEQVEPAMLRGRLRKVEVPASQVSLLLWNGKHPALALPAVRRALSLLVDRARLVREARHGLGEPLSLPPPLQAPADKADLAAAEALLDGAGAQRLSQGGPRSFGGRPLRLGLLAPAGATEAAQAARGVAEAAAAAGIKIEVEIVELGALQGRLRRGAFDAALLAWAWTGEEPDLSPLLRKNGAQAFGRCDTPELDGALDALRRAVGPERRRAALGQLAALLRDQEPVTFLYRPRHLLLLERRVQPEQPPLLGDFVALRSLWVKP